MSHSLPILFVLFFVVVIAARLFGARKPSGNAVLTRRVTTRWSGEEDDDDDDDDDAVDEAAAIRGVAAALGVALDARSVSSRGALLDAAMQTVRERQHAAVVAPRPQKRPAPRDTTRTIGASFVPMSALPPDPAMEPLGPRRAQRVKSPLEPLAALAARS